MIQPHRLRMRLHYLPKLTLGPQPYLKRIRLQALVPRPPRPLRQVLVNARFGEGRRLCFRRGFLNPA
jgi:hypothetical protein